MRKMQGFICANFEENVEVAIRSERPSRQILVFIVFVHEISANHTVDDF